MPLSTETRITLLGAVIAGLVALFFFAKGPDQFGSDARTYSIRPKSSQQVAPRASTVPQSQPDIIRERSDRYSSKEVLSYPRSTDDVAGMADSIRKNEISEAMILSITKWNTSLQFKKGSSDALSANTNVKLRSALSHIESGDLILLVTYDPAETELTQRRLEWLQEQLGTLAIPRDRIRTMNATPQDGASADKVMLAIVRMPERPVPQEQAKRP